MPHHEEAMKRCLANLLGYIRRTEMELNSICITLVPSDEERDQIEEAMRWINRPQSEEWNSPSVN